MNGSVGWRKLGHELVTAAAFPLRRGTPLQRHTSNYSASAAATTL